MVPIDLQACARHCLQCPSLLHDYQNLAAPYIRSLAAAPRSRPRQLAGRVIAASVSGCQLICEQHRMLQVDAAAAANGTFSVKFKQLQASCGRPSFGSRPTVLPPAAQTSAEAPAVLQTELSNRQPQNGRRSCQMALSRFACTLCRQAVGAMHQASKKVRLCCLPSGKPPVCAPCPPPAAALALSALQPAAGVRGVAYQ